MHTKTRVYPQWFIDELVEEKDIVRAKQGDLKSTDIVQFRCSLGHLFTRRVNEHIKLLSGERKNKCPLCSKLCKYTYPQWFIEDLYLEQDKKRAISKELVSEDIVSFICSEGHVYTSKVYNHIKLSSGERKNGCPICKNKRISGSLKKYSLLKKREYPQWFIDDLYFNSDKERAKEGRISVTETLTFLCSKGHIYNQLVYNHIILSKGKRKSGCSVCKEIKKKEALDNYHKSFVREFPNWFINELISDEDKQRAKEGKLTSTDVVTFQCSQGHYYRQRVYNHIDLHTGNKLQGCPVCTHHRSAIEVTIENFITSLGYRTEHGRSLLQNFDFPKNKKRNLELDIYIPEKKIAIEYNGSFWHRTLPEGWCSKESNYHYNKFLGCLKLGILLVSIFDVEWESKKEIIKHYLIDTLNEVENSLSFSKDGYMNNNYPSRKYLNRLNGYLEDYYTKDNMVVYTCGYSKLEVE